MLGGMLPSKLLLNNQRLSNRVMLPKEDGISPDILFDPTLNSSNPESFPREVGRAPVNRLFPKESIFRFMRFPLS